MTRSIKQQLIDVKEKIKNPEHWTTETSAKDIHGNRVPSRSDEAVCWCLMGACIATHIDIEADEYLDKKCYEYCNLSMVTINDELGHAKVMEVLDRAIAEAPEILPVV